MAETVTLPKHLFDKMFDYVRLTINELDEDLEVAVEDDDEELAEAAVEMRERVWDLVKDLAEVLGEEQLHGILFPRPEPFDCTICGKPFLLQHPETMPSARVCDDCVRGVWLLTHG